MTEKPAYRVLDRLINHEWKTNLEVKVQGGSLAFRGFYGEYEVVVGDQVYTAVLDTDKKEIKL